MADGSLASLTVILGPVQPVTRIRPYFERATFECEASDADAIQPWVEPWRIIPRTPEVAPMLEAKAAGVTQAPSAPVPGRARRRVGADQVGPSSVSVAACSSLPPTPEMCVKPMPLGPLSLVLAVM